MFFDRESKRLDTDVFILASPEQRIGDDFLMGSACGWIRTAPVKLARRRWICCRCIYWRFFYCKCIWNWMARLLLVSLHPPAERGWTDVSLLMITELSADTFWCDNLANCHKETMTTAARKETSCTFLEQHLTGLIIFNWIVLHWQVCHRNWADPRIIFRKG